MLDADAHNRLKENSDFLIAVVEADIDIYLSAFQDHEIKKGLDDLSPNEKEKIWEKIHRVENLANPKITGVITSGYGEVYGRNYSGSTEEIYKELMKPHPNIREVDRPEAIGAEAAINRDMTFVTGDKGLQDKMEKYGYVEHRLNLDDFYKLFDT